MESNENSTINNRYNVLELKGKGASAIVYLVEKQDNNKKYAAKVLKEVIPSFEREVAILENLAKLKCPYIMNLIEYGEGPVKIGSNPIQTKQYLILDYASKGEIFDYMICAQKGLSERLPLILINLPLSVVSLTIISFRISISRKKYQMLRHKTIAMLHIWFPA